MAWFGILPYHESLINLAASPEGRKKILYQIGMNRYASLGVSGGHRMQMLINKCGGGNAQIQAWSGGIFI